MKKKSAKGGNQVFNILKRLMVPITIVGAKYGIKKVANKIRSIKKNNLKSKKTRKRVLLTSAS